MIACIASVSPAEAALLACKRLDARATCEDKQSSSQPIRPGASRVPTKCYRSLCSAQDTEQSLQLGNEKLSQFSLLVCLEYPELTQVENTTWSRKLHIDVAAISPLQRQALCCRMHGRARSCSIDLKVPGLRILHRKREPQLRDDSGAWQSPA